jgi:hypothetical protein
MMRKRTQEEKCKNKCHNDNKIITTNKNNISELIINNLKLKDI